MFSLPAASSKQPPGARCAAAAAPSAPQCSLTRADAFLNFLNSPFQLSPTSYLVDARVKQEVRGPTQCAGTCV